MQRGFNSSLQFRDFQGFGVRAKNSLTPEALAGDISQFYPSVNLHEDHWKYQLILTRDGMDPNGDILVGVITKLIFGV